MLALCLSLWFSCCFESSSAIVPMKVIQQLQENIFARNCSYTDANSTTFDFSGLANSQTDYKINYQNFYIFWLNFCRPVVTSACFSSCSACLNITSGGSPHCVGLDSPTFSESADTVVAELTYSSYSTTFYFSCNMSSGVGFPVYTGEFPTGQYHFTWATKFACGQRQTCSSQTSCSSCTGMSGCEWCLDTSSCTAAHNPSCKSFVMHPKFCPVVPCSSFSSCSTCVAQPSDCSWCLDTSMCLPNSSTGSCDDVVNNPQWCTL